MVTKQGLALFTCAAFALFISACTQTPDESESLDPNSAAVEAAVEAADSPVVGAAQDNPFARLQEIGVLEDPNHPDQLRALTLVEEHTGQKFSRNVPVYLISAEALKNEASRWGDSSPENIMGFYTASTQTIFMSPEVAGDRRQFGLRVHELVHALQDQLYGLKELRQALPEGNGDAAFALTALIEGQATQVMIDALKHEQPHVEFIARATRPRSNIRDFGAWQRTLLYGYGARIIQGLQALGGHEAVHQAFSNPPVASTQVFHPDLYQNDDWSAAYPELTAALCAQHRLRVTNPFQGAKDVLAWMLRDPALADDALPAALARLKGVRGASSGSVDLDGGESATLIIMRFSTPEAAREVWMNHVGTDCYGMAGCYLVAGNGHSQANTKLGQRLAALAKSLESVRKGE